MTLYRDRAIVLRTWKLGEYDRILSLLTRDNDKVRAVAKGVRRSTSKTGGRVEPYSEVDLMIWQGKSDLHTVSQVDLVASNSLLHADLSRLVRASTVVEVIDRIALEEYDSSALFLLVSRALAALNESDSEYFVGVFLLRLLGLEGFAPQLVQCSFCGERADLPYFDPDIGETRCQDHPGGQRISPAVLSLLRRCGEGRTGEILRLEDRSQAQEFEEVATRYAERSFGVELRSLRGSFY